MQLAAAALVLSASALAQPQPAAALACGGMRGRELQQCLRRARQEREGAGGQQPVNLGTTVISPEQRHAVKSSASRVAPLHCRERGTIRGRETEV